MNDATDKRSTPTQTRNLPIQDLRDWLDDVDAIGELVRVTDPVDRDEIMSAIVYLLAKQQGSPAVLFEKALGFEDNPIGARLLWNLVGPSLRRVALTLEEPADTPTIDLIRRVQGKMKNRMPAAEVTKIPYSATRSIWTSCQFRSIGP